MRSSWLYLAIRSERLIEPVLPMKLFISTTGTKPTSAEATITTGNGAATQRIYVGPTGTGPNVIFDRLLVDDVPILSNP